MAVVRVKESWDKLVRWYRHARGKQSHPTREGLDRELSVRDELYRCRPPERLKVPILFQPTEFKDEVPTEVEVNLEVRGLRAGRAGGLSGMILEELKGWRKDTNREKEPVGRNW